MYNMIITLNSVENNFDVFSSKEHFPFFNYYCRRKWMLVEPIILLISQYI